MADFHSAALRFGKPGRLMVAPLGTSEPTTSTAIWPTGWVALGYTNEGSTFEYNIDTANVEVAEELDIIARVTTGRNAHLTAALAEVTYRNLTIAFNGGIIVGDGAAWSFSPPDLGDETRIMLGWDSYGGAVTTGTPNTYPKNDLRMIFRQVLQGGTVSMSNAKGAEKQTIAVDFQLEKPASGASIMKIMGLGTSAYSDNNPTG